MPCSHDECPNPAKWCPVLKLRSKSQDRPRKVRFLSLGYCDSHKETSTVQTFLSPEGAVKLRKFIRERGKGDVDPKETTLEWEALSDSQLAKLNEASDSTRTDTTLPF